jgi:uncharacterized membrane protein
MEQPKKIIATSMILTIFVLVVSLAALYVQAQIEAGTVCTCAIPLPVLVPLLSSIGLLVGTFIYYISSPKFEKRGTDPKPLLKFFDPTEQRIMSAIIESRNEISQAKIVSRTGLPKVKVFRSLEKLRLKGVLEKERFGKTNKIRLSKDVMDIFA